MKKWNQNWTMPVKVLLAGAGIAVSAVLVPLVVSAVAPPANSVIGNQATAIYYDLTGQQQLIKSNQVNTTVAQIGDLTLSTDGVKTGAAGVTVYVNHTLKNTGNGSDDFRIKVEDSPALGTFDNIVVYADTGSTGKPNGAPLCATPAQGSTPLCTAGFVQTVAGNNQTFEFLVAYTIPPSATTPNTPFDTATVTATPVPSSITYATSSATRTDTVNLTTGTAFSSSKAIDKPGVSAPATLSAGWPMVKKGGGSSDASCQATIAGVNAAAANCVYTVFTISYNNIGGATGSYSMIDAVPAGFTYVPGTAVWSGASGIAMNDGATAGTVGTSPNVVSSFFSTADKTLHATVSNVVPNTTGTISFVVMVNSDAIAGVTGPNTTNVAKFTTTDCDASCASTTTPKEPTNPTTYPVTSIYKVIAAKVSNATAFDSDNGAPPLPNKTGVDLASVPSAFLGSKVTFSNFVINKGNTTDIFNVAIDPANNNFPVGTTFDFFTADGLNSVLDHNGDGKIDTGSLGIGAFVEIKVVATLPKTATALTGPFDALMTATSVGDSTVKDSVWDQLDTLKSSKVDLTNTPDGNRTIVDGTPSATQNCTANVNCDLGQGPSPQPTDTESTQPGKPATFPIYITNEDTSSGSATYNLTATVPPGWGVKFVDGTNANASCTDAAITTVTVNSGTSGPNNPAPANEKKVLACITPITGTNPGTTPVSITATKVGDPNIADTVTDAVKVTKAVDPKMQLSPPTATNSAPNSGTVVQPATLTNTGTTACGQGAGFNVSVAVDSASFAAGWRASVYFDANKDGVIGVNDPVIDTSVASTVANLTSTAPSPNAPGILVPLQPAPGNTLGLPLLVKTFAPAGAVLGSTATVTLTVTDLNTVTPAENCGAQQAVYSTTATNGQLRVLKKQWKDPTCAGASPVFDVANLSVKPGECIVYQVVATNEGNAAVTNVSLNDIVQQYTDYYATQPTGQCAVSTGSVGIPVISATGTPITVSCAAVSPGVTLNPTGTMTMIYRVQVQQN